MKIQKKIAVVIPVFNGGKSIMFSIKSLMQQTINNWICIIVNDGSTDDTLTIINSIEDLRFRVINLKENSGRAYARQVALNEVKKLKIKYMCMLDADDCYYPQKLAFQYNFMENNPNIALMSTSLAVTNEDKQLVNIIESNVKNKIFTYNNYKNYTSVPHASSIIRVNEIGETKFDVNLRFSEDKDFLRYLLINKKYIFIPKITYVYNRGNSFSLKKYQNSIDASKYSIKKLPINSLTKVLISLKLDLKKLIVSLLVMFNWQQFYLRIAGRPPSSEELREYKSFLKKK